MSVRRVLMASFIPLLVSGGFAWWQGPSIFAQPTGRHVDGAPSAKLHPELVRLAEGTDETPIAWVFFADKGICSHTEKMHALRALERSYNPRALRRRALRGDNSPRGGALYDERDLPVADAYVAQVAATGARVRITSRWLNAVSVRAAREQLDAIAALPFVRALQPVARARRGDDLRALEAHGAGPVASPTPRSSGVGPLDYGLSTEQLTQISLISLHEGGADGAGVIIGVLDTGFRRDHVALIHPDHPLTIVAEYDFINDDPDTDVEPGDPSAQHFHGTTILGTLASYMPGELVGGAFGASFILCKTEDTTAEYPAEEDYYVAGLEFIEINGGDVATSSLAYIDWYTQADLDGRTAVTTIAVNTATANGVHCCTAAGNDGHDSDPATSHLRAPADALQVVTCGAVDSAGAVASFSSDGPTADGRVKPEVMARGVDTFSISAYDTSTYNSVGGTSMSTPLVASAVACLTQIHPDWTVDQMRSVLFATADHFVANGAHDPLFLKGYGVLNAYAAGLDCNLNGVLDECDIDCGTPGGLCDVLGCGGSNDCNTNGIPDDCEPDCNTNGIADGCDLANCNTNDAGCQDCDRNGIPDECDVPFPQQGRISLDAGGYVCQSTATIQLNDCGLNQDDATTETVSVVLLTESEPGGESLLLTETGLDTGTFRGSVLLSTVNSSGVLLVSDGDTVTASYVDADDGLGGTDVLVTGHAVIDCRAPVVADVEASAVGPFDAVVSLTTDEPAVVTVRYGLTCDALDYQANEAEYATAFDIPLSGLAETTTYFYTIEVADVLANSETYDNAGLCFTFGTPEIPNYFTERFVVGDNDLDNRTILFTPDGSADVYAPCTYEILGLPTDPAGGTTLSLGIDDFAAVSLPPGASLKLYGVPYSRFYAGSNGYITFGAGDTTAYESLANHFGLPRISALFDDLNPAAGGTISWKMLGDRVAVTYEDVPEYFTNNSNTFQVEMYFDGRIRISYLELAAQDGLAGLSAGTGLVAGFAESDLSEMGDCGPRPPIAVDAHVTTPVNAPLQISLPVVDDGQPDPPGALTYTIVSLPGHGTLSEPGAGAIPSAPHTLAGHAGLVDYAPDAWYSGPDTIQFRADDGGDPPDGGDSNVATVVVSVGTLDRIYSFDMRADPGWTPEGQWAFGQPLGGGSHDGDPSAGYTGRNVYGYNLAGDYAENLPPTHLTTTALDCGRLTLTEVRFHRWLGVEDALYDHATLSASNDGTSWVAVWDHEGDTISDASWVAQSYNMSAVADGHAAVYLRWTMGPTDSIVNYPGWNIDDVEIWATRTTLPGDYDENGVVDVEDFAGSVGCYAGPAGGLDPGCERVDMDLDGDADLFDWGVYQTVFGQSAR
jgi:hypothetical protein